MRPRDPGDTGPLTTVPDFSGLSVRQVAEECQELGLEVTISGTGVASKQKPAPGARVAPGAVVQVQFAR